ncbi:hypothetical protein QTP86_009861 [Hemibagrus guttatus]|nr:hypothetical protein QTP86_009861 [Hemibagrus guttatus]
MRRYVRLVSVCVISVFVLVLYVFEQLASSLETEDGWREPLPERGGRVGGLSLPHSEHRYAVDKTSSAVLEADKTEPVRLAVVACGPRLEETLTMLKSAVLFSRRTLHFHIFAEDELHSGFKDALESWPARFRSKFNYTTYPITFPSDNAKEWKRLFKPCASQRLFLPLILTEVDSLLYVDTDILFLQPVEEIWNFLSQFNSSHMAAMAPEHEEPRIAWYNRFARHPYYGKTGVNSGVMLMNVTRVRAKRFKNDMTTVHLRWKELLMPLLQKYKLNITWGDQDLLNIIFHYNPESLFVFPCHWNYRPDHCIYGSNCAAAEQHGVYILHGNRGVYHDDKQPAFRAIYEAIQKLTLGHCKRPVNRILVLLVSCFTLLIFYPSFIIIIIIIIIIFLILLISPKYCFGCGPHVCWEVPSGYYGFHGNLLQKFLPFFPRPPVFSLGPKNEYIYIYILAFGRRAYPEPRTMLQMFYHSVVASVIFCAVVCWGSRVKTADANRLNKLIRKAGSVMGVELESLIEVSERRMLRKLFSILTTHHTPWMGHRSPIGVSSAID